MLRETEFVAAAVADNTDLISPETRVVLNGLDLAAARPQGTLIAELYQVLEKLDRSLTPAQIA